MSADPRVWYDTREGEGRPIQLGAKGLYSDWDEHFGSAGEIIKWEIRPEWVSSIHSEMNDYFRLLERNGSWYRKTWFFDDDGRIEGYMILGWEDAPPTHDKANEFSAWAQKNHPAEWAYLRPSGSLDPTGDRAERTRALLVKWRSSAGLRPLDVIP